MGHNGLITLQGKIKPSSEVHPATHELILGPWYSLAEEIGVPPGEKNFAELAIEKMGQSASVADSGKEFKECGMAAVAGSDDRGLLKSALHKSIRYGLEQEAVAYYRTLASVAGRYAADKYIRNNIIYEDVGLGDPVLCEVVSRAFRTASHENLRLHLIRAACKARKSRVQTDAWQHLTYSGVWEAKEQKVTNRYPGQALEYVASRKMTFAEAMVFLETRRKTQPRSTVVDALGQLDLPDFLKWSCAEALQSNHQFWAAVAMLSCLYREEWKAVPYQDDAVAVPFEIEKIGQFILPAIDQFTSIGKRAYREFRKSHPDYFVQNDGVKLDLAMFKHDVFRAESEILYNRVGSPSAMHLSNEALDECWRVEGRDPAEARKSVRRINRNLGPLNAARRAVME